MPGARPQAAASSAATASPHHRRRAASATLPTTAARLARDFRPTKTQSTLTKRSDGLYNEPYSAIVEREDDVSVLCVQHTAHNQVLVRYMPEREWQRILRHSQEVYPGQEGKSSLHVLVSPEMSTLPRSFHQDSPATSTTNTSSNGHAAIPPSFTTPATAEAATAEPAVFDYFVAPESRVKTMCRGRKLFDFTYLLKTRYNRSELQRVAREDCRAALAVERRNIFLRQYQRDMQCRMTGVSLYTVGKELPEQFVQTFFMLVENAQAMRRYQQRVNSNNSSTQVPRSSNRSRRDTARTTTGTTRGRYLFTMDQAYTNCGERMPFAGQSPADGFVVVTVGPTPDAFNAAWQPWSPGGRFSSTMDEDDDKPFVPYEYGCAEYLPRPEEHSFTNSERTTNRERVQCSSPLPPRFPDWQVSKKVSGLSSNGVTSPLGLSRSASSSPFCVP